jgi:uncharacterized membrane protein
MPPWALSVAYWLHMLATVTWIGSLASLALLVLPAAQRVLDSQAYALFLESLQRRLDPLGWFSVALLAGTGLFQMSANTNYHGFLAIDSPWATAILLKHGVYFLMILVSAYLTWGMLPQIRRAVLLLGHGKEAPDMQHYQRRSILLLRLNLLLAVVVLALTAMARAS